jgi:hypothetical protein
LRTVVSVVFALTLLFLLTRCDSYPGMGTVTLGGMVSLEDGTPLGGIEVTIFWPEIEQELTLVTDTAGRYRHEYADMFDDYRVTVTPLHPDHVFSPPDYDLPRVGGDFLALDFTAMPSTPDTAWGLSTLSPHAGGVQ